MTDITIIKMQLWAILAALGFIAGILLSSR